MSVKAVELLEHTVIKTDSPALMRIEVEKTRRAFEIGQDCGLFRIPKVLDYYEDKGVAVFERLYGIQPTNALISSQTHGELLAIRLATSLAIVHKELKLPDNMILPLPTELESYGSKVFIHGDLSTENVCFDEENSSIVILDWQMTGVHGGQATYGTPYFDLIWFVNNLIYRPRIRYLLANPLASITRMFIETYFETTGNQYDRDEFSRYARHFFKIRHRSRKENASRRERLLLWRSHALAEMFIDSLQMIGEKTC